MKTLLMLSVAIIGASSFAASAATVLPGIGTYEGNAGVGAPNGVVTASPVGANYVYVSTEGSSYTGAGYGLGSETNGSELTTNSFSANAGDVLEYYFNFVTSDGAGFADYVYAGLNDIANVTTTNLFNARTVSSGDTVPGTGLPAIAAGVTLTPASSAIIGGGPAWAQLGGDSGECFSSGCGYTGWIKSQFTIANAGTYSFTFGAVNWLDQAYATGFAIAGLKVGDVIIIDPDGPSPVPLPAGFPLVLSGLAALGLVSRKKKANS